ncbi:MAG: hypothetical protein A2Y57_01675 [Candidatus Woykebacteria bacterium RBG_13_40_7b]|uniref:Apea-like HEPN domain-containing protein n=1 Tax=Candidatus Woykebacteria bacterium RBG_13_40_7b TaxID=1802594 RepID=A0A1G1W7B3_9BACT|nr:MAG: hypothetical protein A2Y57_01675 [Candidatus Woykebacteria bacterium RBG_13_40_7b]
MALYFIKKQITSPLVLSEPLQFKESSVEMEFLPTEEAKLGRLLLNCMVRSTNYHKANNKLNKVLVELLGTLSFIYKTYCYLEGSFLVYKKDADRFYFFYQEVHPTSGLFLRKAKFDEILKTHESKIKHQKLKHAIKLIRYSYGVKTTYELFFYNILAAEALAGSLLNKSRRGIYYITNKKKLKGILVRKNLTEHDFDYLYKLNGLRNNVFHGKEVDEIQLGELSQKLPEAVEDYMHETYGIQSRGGRVSTTQTPYIQTMFFKLKRAINKEAIFFELPKIDYLNKLVYSNSYEDELIEPYIDKKSSRSILHKY